MVLVAALVLAGCTTTQGHLGLVTFAEELVALKVLRPNATGRSCATWILGIPVGSENGTIEEAARQILALDPEGTVVHDLAVTRRTVNAGVFTRRCVEIRGDLAREIRSIVLPTSGDGHHAHH